MGLFVLMNPNLSGVSTILSASKGSSIQRPDIS